PRADRRPPPPAAHQRGPRPGELAGHHRRSGGAAGRGAFRARPRRCWPNGPSWSSCSFCAGTSWAASQTTNAPLSWPRCWCAMPRTTVRPGWPGPGHGPPSTVFSGRLPTSTPRDDVVWTGRRWTRSGRRSSRRSGATPTPACCAGTRRSAGPTSPRWVRWAVLEAEHGKVTEAERLFTEARRRYRGVSPFPVASLDFGRGLMWLGQRDLHTARAWFDAAVQRVPAYAPALGHRGKGDAALGGRGDATALLRPLAVSSDAPEYAASLASVLSDAGQPLEAEQWCMSAAARYDELVVPPPEAL